MFALKHMKSTASLVAVAALAACGSDSTGPDSVNPATLSAGLTNVTATFTNNVAFQSLQSLALLFPQYAATSALRASLPVFPDASGPWADARWEREALITALSLAPRSTEALFPVNVLGKTLVWNPDSSKYVVDPALTGAPAEGIRIRLYSVNTQTGQPTTAVLGHVDLTDESTPQANKLGVLLTLAATTIADYDITAVSGTNTSQFTLAGYIVNGDGTGRVDFTFLIDDNSLTGASSFHASLSAQGGAQVTIEFANASNGDESLSFLVSQGGNSIEITAVAAGSSHTGQVKYNGAVVATITEDANGDPVFTGVNGHTISAQDRASLLNIIDTSFEVVFGLLLGMFSPALVVFSGI